MTQSSGNAIPRPIDSTLHGATDYSAATTLLTVFPRLVGIQGTRAARQIRIAGAIHGGYSTITDYPLGVVKVLPYKAHLALDAIGALALGATPFVTGQWKRRPSQWVPHVALALFELGSLVLTDPSALGDAKLDVAAKAREHNMEDPSRKVNADAPAVTPAAAKA